MPFNHEHEALGERLRAELVEAEERLHQATTPESKSKAVDDYERALSRYSRLILYGEVPEEGASGPALRE
jgi:hypothetical protein